MVFPCFQISCNALWHYQAPVESTQKATASPFILWYFIFKWIVDGNAPSDAKVDRPRMHVVIDRSTQDEHKLYIDDSLESFTGLEHYGNDNDS